MARTPLKLDDLRLGFRCTQRWDDMLGDDRVRACAGCNQPVYNLSGMTRAEAEALLATHGQLPCVRFFRRPDGSVMTSDCPTSTRVPARRLAVAAGSLAAASLAAAPAAMAQAAGDPAEQTANGSGSDAALLPGEVIHVDDTVHIDDTYVTMGIPVDSRSLEEVGVIVTTEHRPAVEWSVWGRLGVGESSPEPTAIARRVTAHEPGVEPIAEAAAGVDLTFKLARDGDLRIGAWGEVRTTSDPVAGAELVLEGLPPHPYTSRIGRTGSLVLRAGANTRIITGAVGVGF
ncbi:MAG: hypothetical protein JO257_35375, partial [Deltaproteobacteria bacterium]|nr:hypothetical protein [Deltaproteobacteria bacterium]